MDRPGKPLNLRPAELEPVGVMLITPRFNLGSNMAGVPVEYPAGKALKLIKDGFAVAAPVVAKPRK